MKAAAAVLLALVPALAGCAAPPAPRLEVRAGDFIVADVTESLENGTETKRADLGRWFLGSELPSRIPEGWSRNETLLAPPGLTAAALGMRAGDEKTVTVPAEKAYGPRREQNVLRVPRDLDVGREIEEPAALHPEAADAAPGDKVRLSWWGAAMNATVLDSGKATLRAFLEPGEEHRGALLEHPDYWNANYRLWRSVLTGWNETHLQVRHAAENGTQAVVGGLTYRVVEVGEQITVDFNHPLSGVPVTYAVRLHAIVFPAGGPRSEAPDLAAEGLDGSVLRLSDLLGSVVVLDFFASWCITCKLQVPNLAEAHRRLGTQAEFLSISIDPRERREDVIGFIADGQRGALRIWGPDAVIDWPFGIDRTGTAARDYSVFILSKEVVVDAQGRIRATFTGPHPPEEIVSAVQSALSGG